jgi:hypothetical protein
MSKFSDFNPTIHMELEEELSESDSEEKDPYAIVEDQEFDNTLLIVERVRNINRVWIHIEPSGTDFYMAMNDALNEGLDALMVFRKWARHSYMDKYECILEEWDDRVCKAWGPASKSFLSPDEWLMTNPIYKNREHKLRNYINRAFSHVHKFFDNLDPVLNSFWENLNIDFELCRNPKL